MFKLGDRVVLHDWSYTMGDRIIHFRDEGYRHGTVAAIRTTTSPGTGKSRNFYSISWDNDPEHLDHNYTDGGALKPEPISLGGLHRVM